MTDLYQAAELAEATGDCYKIGSIEIRPDRGKEDRENGN